MQLNLHRSPGSNWLALAAALTVWGLPLVHPALPIPLVGHDFTRLCQLTIVLLATLHWVIWPDSMPKLTGGAWPWFLLVAFVAASCALAAHPWIAVREVLVMVGLIVLAARLHRPLMRAEARRRTLDALAIGAAIYGVIWVLLLGLGSTSGTFFSPWDLTTGFDNARFLNHAQTVALPLVGVVAASADRARWLRITAFVALVCGGAILTLYLARSSILALLIGAIVMYCVFGRKIRAYVSAMTAGLALGSILLGISWWLWIRAAVGSNMTDSLMAIHFRDYLNFRALDMWLASPWFGVGPMHFSHAVNPIAAHAHDFFVQVLAEYGAPAACLLAWLVGREVRPMIAALRRYHATEPTLAAGLCVASVAVLVDAAFSGNFVMPISQLWIALLLALLMSVKRWHESPAEEVDAFSSKAAHRAGWLAVRVALSMVMVAASASAFDEGLHRLPPHLETGEPMKQPIGEVEYSPRFWAHGWF
ncbi:O-antigen ligase family protein [Roseateles sp.]|uniref:O-antigen ligase family protein n=1 Tax=Roseateles sp. TaxID=1971397 RepID=UPI0031DBAB4E